MTLGWGRRRIDPEGFADGLGRLGPPSSLLLVGPEILLRDEIIAQMNAAVLGQQDQGRWNRESYSARETSLSEIVGGLQVVGLFAERRLVILSEVERYGRASAADRTDLWDWLDRPTPEVHLILTSEKPLWELERGSEFVKGTLRRAEAVVRLEHPDFERALQLVRKVGKERYGLDLPPESARRLVEAVGPNLLELRQELERLALRLGPGGRVDGGVLDRWLRGGIAGSASELERALLAGERALALRYWESAKRGMSTPAVTWMLGSRHLDPRWGWQGGGDRAPSRPRLAHILRECYRLERAVKLGEIPASLQEIAFEEMVWGVCERGGANPPMNGERG